MHTWRWEELATATLARRLYAALGHSAPGDLTAARGLLTRLFSASGGVPVSQTRPELSTVADRLLRDAATASTTRWSGGQPATLPGVAFVDTTLPVDEEAVPVGVRHVNWCSAAELAALPVIGPGLAQGIVAERRSDGTFASMAELTDRVAGLGADGARRLAACLSFDTSDSSPDDGVGTFAAAARRCGADVDGDPVIGTLELILATCAGHPAPASRMKRPTPSSPIQLADLAWFSSASTTALTNDQYAEQVAAWLAAAGSTIDVCMFHIALGRATQTMIDAVVAAHSRGVAVRVLLDQDRPEDPYQSTIVNTRARRHLEAAGVQVRQDLPDSLLHSKYLVVDRETVILGSHNWSAGSFAGFDDVSVAIRSPELAQALTDRFEAIWGP